MKSDEPLSNSRALLFTIGAAAGFFLLFMGLPSPHTRSVQQPVETHEGVGGKEPAAVLFATRCTQCHALPALTHRSPGDWRILVLKMNRYMKQTGRRSLTDEDAMEVTRFIVRNQK